MPPEIIAGRYRVEREVGRGGMGSVWLCRDERLGREVAIKQVGGLPGESNLHLTRALREARHSAALNHPNVVAIFDALEDGDQVWLVMEYVPSRTLDEIVRTDGPLSPERAAGIAAQVADGLAAAHALGTVHRDVKPSNILVRADDRALIADFGIARTVGQEQLTRSGLVTGTPAYFAPELARGEEPSSASDVWALGVTLYAAVEGEPPYPDQANAIALLNTIASQDPPDPQHAGALAEPIARMMDPDPATRWSMAEAATVLRTIATEVPVADREADAEAEPPTAVLAEDPPVEVPPTEVPPAEVPGSPSTVPTAVPKAVSRAVAKAVPSAGPEAPPSDPARRRRGTTRVLTAVLLLAVLAIGGWWLSRDPADETTADPPGNSSSRTPSPTPSRSPSASSSAEAGEGASDQPSATQEPSETTQPSQANSPVTSTAGDAAEFVIDYYSFLPEDTDTSWNMLSPELQAQIGRGTFVGFWATIDDVIVDGTEPVDGGIVEVTLTYTTDGRSEQETRQLQVEQTDNGYLITDDLGAV